MPALAFLAVAGLALLALLFVADATLKRVSPPIVTSSRVGLPDRWHSDAIQVLTSPPAPTPDMTSPAVLSAQPKITPAANRAQAEAPPEINPETNRVTRPFDYRQERGADRFSIRGQ